MLKSVPIDATRVLILAVALLTASYGGASVSEINLARSLADEHKRAATIQRLAASGGSEEIKMLLKWTEKPPQGVSARDLYFGMIEAFGRLRTRQAIPFLIRHINLRHLQTGNLWMRTDDVVIEWSPAIQALLAIGPEAIPALSKAYSTAEPNDRLAIVLTLAHTHDAAAKPTLQSILGIAERESTLARDGLAALAVHGSNRPPPR